jgi:hypothetical protein
VDWDDNKDTVQGNAQIPAPQPKPGPPHFHLLEQGFRARLGKPMNLVAPTRQRDSTDAGEICA